MQSIVDAIEPKLVENNLESSLKVHNSDSFSTGTMDIEFVIESSLPSIHELAQHSDLYQEQIITPNLFGPNNDKDLLQNSFYDKEVYKDLPQIKSLMDEYSMEYVSYINNSDMIDYLPTDVIDYQPTDILNMNKVNECDLNTCLEIILDKAEKSSVNSIEIAPECDISPPTNKEKSVNVKNDLICMNKNFAQKLEDNIFSKSQSNNGVNKSIIKVSSHSCNSISNETNLVNLKKSKFDQDITINQKCDNNLTEGTGELINCDINNVNEIDFKINLASKETNSLHFITNINTNNSPEGTNDMQANKNIAYEIISQINNPSLKDIDSLNVESNVKNENVRIPMIILNDKSFAITIKQFPSLVLMGNNVSNLKVPSNHIKKRKSKYLKKDLIIANKKIHSCPVCNSIFSRRSALKNHLLLHESVKSFSCNVCLKSFAKKSTLSEHCIIHEPKRHFICDVCHKTFVRKNDLDKHAYIHSKIKPFICQFCNKGFTRQIQLQKHHRFHHPGKRLPILTGGKPILKDVAIKSNKTVDGLQVLASELQTQTSLSSKSLYELGDAVEANSGDKCLALNDHLINAPATVAVRAISQTSVFPANEELEFVPENHIEKGEGANDLFTTKNTNFSKIPSHSDILVLECIKSNGPILENAEDFVCSSDKVIESGICESNKFVDPSSRVSASLEMNQDKLTKSIADYICNICHKTYASKSSLNAHISLHANMKPYICEICYATFAKKCTLVLHSLIHSGEHPHLCSICEKKFKRKHDLKKHILIHTGERPYVCDFCNARFNHQNNLKRHKRIHTGEKLYVCNICRKSFADASTLSTHTRQHVKDAELTNNVNKQLKLIKEKLHTCDVCNTGFSRKDRLLRHKKTHDAKEVHNCSVCNYTFKSKEQLHSHLLIHVDVSLDDIADSDNICDDLDLTKLEPTVQNINKTFSCDLCVKMFSSKKALRVHRMIHTGERPYACQICQKRFTQSITLKRHKVVHTGERPYTCNMCNKSFTRKTSLRKHIIIHSQKNLC